MNRFVEITLMCLKRIALALALLIVAITGLLMNVIKIASGFMTNRLAEFTEYLYHKVRV